MPGMTNPDTEAEADSWDETASIQHCNASPDIESYKTTDARQLSDKNVNPSSDKVMLASAVSTFWGFQFLWNSIHLDLFQEQTFLLFLHTQSTNYECDGQTIRTIWFPPMDLFLRPCLCMFYFHTAVFPPHTWRNRVIFLAGWFAIPPAVKWSGSSIISVHPVQKVQYVGNMFYSRGNCSPTTVKKWKKTRLSTHPELSICCLSCRDAGSHQHILESQGFCSEESYDTNMKTRLLISYVSSLWPGILQTEAQIITAPEAVEYVDYKGNRTV